MTRDRPQRGGHARGDRGVAVLVLVLTVGLVALLGGLAVAWVGRAGDVRARAQTAADAAALAAADQLAGGEASALAAAERLAGENGGVLIPERFERDGDEVTVVVRSRDELPACPIGGTWCRAAAAPSAPAGAPAPPAPAGAPEPSPTPLPRAASTCQGLADPTDPADPGPAASCAPRFATAIARARLQQTADGPRAVLVPAPPLTTPSPTATP